MPQLVRVAAVAVGCLLPLSVGSRDAGDVSKRYRALKCPVPRPRGTWAILDRDGANRQVEPYLSSLGRGESGTGAIVSPAFSISADRITYTVCGHDGQGGGRNENFIALVDAKTNETLKRTTAPGSDLMQHRTWDVGELRGRPVRIEVHDGHAGGAYAWIGIGTIDAGRPLRVDFRKGMPKGWKAVSRPPQCRTEFVRGGVPFLRCPSVYGIIPSTGAVEIPCGFAAQRLFVLGCTVAGGRPLEVYGQIEIVYHDGVSERHPLMFGYTLDGEGKLLSRSSAIHLRPSGDPFQHYLVLGPRPEVIDKLRIKGNPQHELVPRITAITCQTAAEGENLLPLPDCRPTAEEETWIRSHTITSSSPKLAEIAAEIRRAHKM